MYTHDDKPVVVSGIANLIQEGNRDLPDERENETWLKQKHKVKNL